MVFDTPTKLLPTEWPVSLRPLLHIPEPPKSLWVQGVLPPADLTLLCVVGSRNFTSYGKQVVESLIADLSGYPIGIVSGLALGMDGLAHEAALRAGLYTLAVPGSGLDEKVLYPARHRPLARRIVESGGGLLSELEPTAGAALWTFPRRNRVMAGLCRATLLIEASEKSGTLITARLAVDYNRELLVVPGSIFSKNSYGVHQFLKLGATPVTTAADIIDVLGLPEMTTTKNTHPALSPAEEQVLALLHEPQDRDTLIRLLKISTAEATTLLMLMELHGHIAVEASVYRSLR